MAKRGRKPKIDVENQPEVATTAISGDEKAEAYKKMTENADMSPDEVRENEPEDNGLPKKDLFRIDEVATYLGVTERTIRLWIENGYFEIEKLHGTIRILRRSILNFRLRSRVKFS